MHGTQEDTGRSISPTIKLLQLRMKIKLVHIVTAGITQKKKAKTLYFDCGPTLSQHKTLSSYQTLYLISPGTAFTISLVQLCITVLSCIVNLLLGTLRILFITFYLMKTGLSPERYTKYIEKYLYTNTSDHFRENY